MTPQYVPGTAALRARAALLVRRAEEFEAKAARLRETAALVVRMTEGEPPVEAILDASDVLARAERE